VIDGSGVYLPLAPGKDAGSLQFPVQLRIYIMLQSKTGHMVIQGH